MLAFRLASRQAEGLIGSMICLLGLTLRVPDHVSLSRRSAMPAGLWPQPTAADGYDRPVNLLVDSTGLNLFGAGGWLIEQHGATRQNQKKTAGRSLGCDHHNQPTRVVRHLGGQFWQENADGLWWAKSAGCRPQNVLLRLPAPRRQNAQTV